MTTVITPYIQNRSRFTARRITNAIMLTLTGAVTLLALAPLFWIMGYVIFKGGQYLNLDFITQMPKPLGIQGGGVLHAMQGTLILTVLSALIAIPPSILIAFYAAFRPNTLLGIVLRFGTDVLSGVPSIVIGLVGYALIVKPQGHYSGLAGSFAIAVMMLPVIIRTTEEMLKLVPSNLREGSLALGATEWKTSLSVILPAAANGVITGVMLGIARVSGETAPLIFTALGNERYNIGQIVKGGDSFFQTLYNIVEQPMDSLPLTLWKYAQQPFPERVNQAWAVALVLMIFVLSINIVVRLWIRSRGVHLKG